jgi:hypothetical protein
MLLSSCHEGGCIGCPSALYFSFCLGALGCELKFNYVTYFMLYQLRLFRVTLSIYFRSCFLFCHDIHTFHSSTRLSLLYNYYNNQICVQLSTMELPEGLADFLLFDPLPEDPLLPAYVSHHIVKVFDLDGTFNYECRERSDMLRHASNIVLQSDFLQLQL